jgi:hypothetical protein
MSGRAWLLAAASGLLLMAACDGNDTGPALTREQLLDPENCKDCHPKHYEEWSSSMHAYATRDPVFIAMNRRGQEEAQIGEFCVQCHAPMAVREKAITNFADLSNVPKHLQGVTCYFCHNAVNVKEPHTNANIELANDTIMRGALGNPLKPTAHGVMPKSKLHDPTGLDSSVMCGTCHDLTTPAGVHLERTLEEYLNSVQAKPVVGNFSSCQDCHMRRHKRDELAAPGYPGVTARKTHSHLFPAVDLALTNDMPNQQALRAAVENCELQQNTLSHFQVVYGANWLPGEPFNFIVEIEHIAAHNLPSGASADRRLWIEVVAYDETGQVVLESGRIADGELESKPEGDPNFDPQFMPFRDYATDDTGKEAHMFWDVRKVKPDVIPYTIDPTMSHTATRTFTTNRSMRTPPARIELWLRLRPMGVDVLQDLVTSGHLDEAFVSAMPTLTITHQEAILDPAKQSFKMNNLSPSDCETYQMAFD